MTFESRDGSGASTKDLYIVLTGTSQGLPLAEKIEIEGKEKVLKRLARFI